MRISKRTTKSYSIERQVEVYVTRTRGEVSASQRVNELLRRAIEEEREEQLEREAAQFFSELPADLRKEERAFQKATKRSLARG